MHDPDVLATRLLDVIESEILPLTEAGVAAGNKIFGAALLEKRSLKTVVAETNNEMENPLWHGEMHALKRFYEIPQELRPATEDLLFLSTHEPCSLCLSAITWCGFDNFYYFFSHEDSRDSFAIPHDLKILKEVFGREDYRTENEFWTSQSVHKLIQNSSNTEALNTRASSLNLKYSELSQSYQSDKSANNIPLN